MAVHVIHTTSIKKTSTYFILQEHFIEAFDMSVYFNMFKKAMEHVCMFQCFKWSVRVGCRIHIFCHLKLLHDKHSCTLFVSIEVVKGATIFFGIGGVMNFRKYLSIIFVTPPIWWSKLLWPPSGATMLKKHVTPNAHSAENMHFWGYFIEQNFH